MVKIVYGLDFGTSNSAIAIFREVREDGRVEVITGGDKAQKTMPSVIYHSQHTGFLVGEAAVRAYIEGGMQGRFIQSIKSVLPDEMFHGTYIGIRRYIIEDLVSFMLAELKARADLKVGEEVSNVVIGRPARFSDNIDEDRLAEGRLIDSAKKAGFKEIHVQFEPIAAAISYETQLSAPELVLVIDLGGGTTDITIMRLDPRKNRLKDRKEDILATEGIHLGGDNFSSLIAESKLMKHFGEDTRYRSGGGWLTIPRILFQAIVDWKRIAFLKADRSLMECLERVYAFAEDKEAVGKLRSLIKDNLGYQLFLAVEKAKCELSSSRVTNINFMVPPIFILEPITRFEFEKIMEESIKRIERCIKLALSQAGVSAEKIGAVFATGGSSHIPCIMDFLRKKFPHSKIHSGDAFMSVARGLAMSSVHFF
jgi:hypothetical chaperone protein